MRVDLLSRHRWVFKNLGASPMRLTDAVGATLPSAQAWPSVGSSPHLGHSLHWSPSPALEAGAVTCRRTFRSGLKHDVFELLSCGPARSRSDHALRRRCWRCRATKYGLSAILIRLCWFLRDQILDYMY